MTSSSSRKKIKSLSHFFRSLTSRLRVLIVHPAEIARPEQVLFDWYPSDDSDARVDASMRLTVGVSFKKASRRLASKRARAGRRLSSFRRLFGPMLHPRNHTRPRTRNVYRSRIYFDQFIFKIYSGILIEQRFLFRGFATILLL